MDEQKVEEHNTNSKEILIDLETEDDPITPRITRNINNNNKLNSPKETPVSLTSSEFKTETNREKRSRNRSKIGVETSNKKAKTVQSELKSKSKQLKRRNSTKSLKSKKSKNENVLDQELKHLQTVDIMTKTFCMNLDYDVVVDKKFMFDLPYVKLNSINTINDESDSDVEVVLPSTSGSPTKPPFFISKNKIFKTQNSRHFYELVRKLKSDENNDDYSVSINKKTTKNYSNNIDNSCIIDEDEISINSLNDIDIIDPLQINDTLNKTKQSEASEENNIEASLENCTELDGLNVSNESKYQNEENVITESDNEESEKGKSTSNKQQDLNKTSVNQTNVLEESDGENGDTDTVAINYQLNDPTVSSLHVKNKESELQNDSKVCKSNNNEENKEQTNYLDNEIELKKTPIATGLKNKVSKKKTSRCGEKIRRVSSKDQKKIPLEDQPTKLVIKMKKSKANGEIVSYCVDNPKKSKSKNSLSIDNCESSTDSQNFKPDNEINLNNENSEEILHDTYICVICKHEFNTKCEYKLHELQHNNDYTPLVILDKKKTNEENLDTEVMEVCNESNKSSSEEDGTKDNTSENFDDENESICDYFRENYSEKDSESANEGMEISNIDEDLNIVPHEEYSSDNISPYFKDFLKFSGLLVNNELKI